jgi:hypothetical protein
MTAPDTTTIPAATGNGGDSTSFGNSTVTPPNGAAGAPAMVMDPGDGSCSATGAEAEVTLQGADLIWVVDNSCSMAIENAAVQANMNRFATTLFDNGVDVQLALISASGIAPAMMCPPDDLLCQVLAGVGGLGGICIGAPFGSGMCPGDSNPPNFLHVDFPVGSNNALQLMMDLYPQYSSILRPGTKKHFVVVTDDNSQVPAATFSQWADSLDPALFSEGWFFHGVFSLSQCLDAAAIGSVYSELVNQTSGVAGDLCLQQFDPVFDALAVDVVEKAELACQWPIPPPPPGEVLDKSLVNVQYTQPDGTVVPLAKIPEGQECEDREGWFYDDESEPSQVLSCPAACERFQEMGGKVDVLFGCVTQVLE